MRDKIRNLIILFILIININNVIAESGNITIETKNVYSDYGVTNSFSAETKTFDFTKLYLYKEGYNIFYGLQVKEQDSGLNILDSGSTTFTIISNGSGSGELIYNSTGKYIAWVCFSGCIFYNSPIRLQYSNTSWHSGIISLSGQIMKAQYSQLSTSKPFMIGVNQTADDNGISHIVDGAQNQLKYTATVGLSDYNIYNFTYFIGNDTYYFNGSITKNNLNTKICINSSSSIYYCQSTYNLVGVNYVGQQLNKIYLNIKYSGGETGDILINNSNPSISLANTTGEIIFSKTAYDYGENVNFSYTITDKNSSRGYGYQLKDSTSGKVISSGNIYNESGYIIIPSYNFNYLNNDTTTFIEIWLREFIDLYRINYIAFDQSFYGSTQQNIFDEINGNFTIKNKNKTVKHNQTLYIDVNISTNGFLQDYMYNYKNDYIFNMNVAKGNNTNVSIYIPNTYPTGNHIIGLYYYDYIVNEYIKLYEDSYYIQSDNNFSIQTDKTVYNQGEIVNIIYYTDFNGYIEIYNNDNNLINNFSFSSGNNFKQHTIDYDDKTIGSNAIVLYNNLGVEMQTLYFYVNKYINPEIIPTVTQPDTQDSLIDIGNEFADITFGNIDINNDNTIDDSEITYTGNKIFKTLLFICFIMICFVAYNTISKKR